MNNSATNGTLLGIGMHFCHQVMMDSRLDLFCPRHVDVVYMTFEIGDLIGCDQPHPHLGTRKLHPDMPPRATLMDFAPDRPHLGRPVPPRKRGNKLLVTES